MTNLIYVWDSVYFNTHSMYLFYLWLTQTVGQTWIISETFITIIPEILIEILSEKCMKCFLNIESDIVKTKLNKLQKHFLK